jgi:excisionase family DNA binding protein
VSVLATRDLSPRDVARSIGVSESSVKRWVDDGALPAMRTAGGHRRIGLAEAVRFVRRSGVPVERPDALLGAGAEWVVPRSDADGSQQVGERLFGLLEQDDAAGARALLLALYVSGWPVAAIGDGPIRLAFERVGTLWQHGPAGIVVEHRATDTCVRALAELRTVFAPPADGAPLALGAAPGGDPYVLPSMMAAAVLAELGFRDRDLGPNVPMDALAAAVQRYAPRIVWLAMSVPGVDGRVASDAVDLAGRLARRRATLVLGGRGVPTLPSSDGLLPLRSMAELAAFARGVGTGR